MSGRGATGGDVPGTVARRTTRPHAVGRGVRLRRVLGRSVLLVRRRAARDAWLLAAFTLLVALTALLAAAGPRLMARALDDATVATIADAGGATDPAASTTVRTPLEGEAASGSTALASFLTVPRFVELPPALAAVTEEVVVALDLGFADVLAPPDDAPPSVRLALLPEGLADDVTVLEGRLPGASADATEVVATQATAERRGVAVGDRLDLAGPERVVTRTDPATGAATEVLEPAAVPVVVVGVVAPVDAADRRWQDLRFAWGDDATLLAGEQGAGTLVDDLGAIGAGTIRAVLDPDAVTYRRAVALRTALEDLVLDPTALTTGLSGVRLLPDDLRPALAAHLAAAPAARAQMSVPLTGVVGVAALVLVLVSGLLVRRRAEAVGLERARGASVPSVAFRLLVEAVLVAGVGAAAGVLVAQRLVPGPVRDAWLLAAVVGVAVLATPLQGALVARRAWTGRREPANRRERDRLARRRALRRVVAEVGVVLLATGAAVSLNRRGLVGGTARSGDPFLALAPLLVAVATTVVALRAYPWPVRALAALGRRSRGVLGVVGAVRASRALAPLPLLALTVGTSVAVTGLLLADTVREGQEAAAWDRIGADARIDGADVGAALPLLRRADGVTAAAGGVTAEVATLDVGAHNETVSVLVVDAAYLDVLAGLPDPPADVDALAALLGAGGEDGAGAPPVPVVVSESLLPRLAGDLPAVSLRGTYLQLRVTGTTDHAPVGEAPGPFVYVDLETVRPLLREEPALDTVWVRGPGAEDAARAAAAELLLPEGSVHTRSGWLADRRDMPLVAGVEAVMLGATAAVGLLAVLALGATVLAGARERGRTLSMLRTLGMRARLGWWLALAELAPVVAAAVVAGAAAGVTVVLLLGGALGLDVLVGGVGLPPLAVAPDAIGLLALGATALLLAAALVEVAAHRRDRLSEVLRVGETTT